MSYLPLRLVPVLDRDRRLRGFDMSGGGTPLSVFNSVRDILGTWEVWLPADAELLASLDAAPTGTIQLKLPADAAELADAARAARALGWRVALEGAPPVTPLLAIADSLLLAPPYPPTDHLRGWRIQDRRLIATHAAGGPGFDLTVSSEFDLLCGFWFASPGGTKPPDASRMTMLKLLALVANDAELADIELAFKREASLTVALLRLVNSVAMGLTMKVTSIRHAITVLGRKQLQRWLHLLLYAQSGKDQGTLSPLLWLAAMRARLMETLAPSLGQDRDAAFMAGVLSLADVLLAMPMAEAVQRLALTEEVSQALLLRGGALGHLLALAEAIESGVGACIDEHAAALGLTLSEEFMRSQIESLRWTLSLEESS